MLRIPRVNVPKPQEKIKTGIALSAGALVRAAKSPDDAYGELFLEVQKRNLLGDGKTFVDLVPRKRAKAIRQEYLLAKQDPDFDLQEFVNRHFYEFAPHKERPAFVSNADRTIDEHIGVLWDELKRRNRRDRGSLLALPYDYVVPGGRFGEQFYWDSYFIMLGLAAEGRWQLVESMMKNYAFMLRKYGFIPTANRTYFLSRSQPPFFALMVDLLARHKGKSRTYLEYLPYMLTEYRFWMRGKSRLDKTEYNSYARLVQMQDGSLMNRYYDNKTTPRPESLREDVETADGAGDRQPEKLYLHLRAAAESGWDFSSRWFLNPHDIRTIHTTDIIPVDLNSLLYILESRIADCYAIMRNAMLEKKFRRLADARKTAIDTYCWNAQEQVYGDYNFHRREMTPHITLAMVFPLFAEIASQEQATLVAKRLKRDFLKAGGLVTTLVENGQQWDSPNGWAPLQWMAIVGLRNYGFDDLADEIKQRWMATIQKVYDAEHKLIEKYDVVGDSGIGGGGEYPLQDGFGWSNGVMSALLSDEDGKL